MKTHRLLVAVLLVVPLFAALSPAQTTREPIDTMLPFEQKWMVPYPKYPTSRVWRFRSIGEVGVYTTAQGVGQDSALLFHQPKGAKPGGEILIFDSAALENEKQHDLTDFKGVCFWLRADGGDGEISLGCNWNQTNLSYPRIGKFPLGQKTWKKFFVPWDKFENPPGKGGFYYINVQLQPATDRECWAVISRISLYKQEQVEEIQPPTEADPPGMIPAGKFVEPSVQDAAKLIPNTLAKLKAGKPVTIVATGDSITAGAQLWYMNKNEKELETGFAGIYHAVLERKLAAHYGYKNHRAVFKMWMFPDKKKDPQGQQHFEIRTGEQPDETGALPFDGLQVIGVGAGGQDSRFGEKHLSDVTQFKPDLVIWAYGGNDVSANRTKEYREPSLRVIEALRQQGTEVIVSVPTPWSDELNNSRGETFRAVAREIAQQGKVPLVNQLDAFLARGDRYRGDLLSDVVHPNEFGHEIMATTLAAGLGVPDQRIWDRPVFRAREDGRKIPD